MNGCIFVSIKNRHTPFIVAESDKFAVVDYIIDKIIRCAGATLQ